MESEGKKLERKRAREEWYPDQEKELLEWFKMVRSHEINNNLTYDMLQSKMHQIMNRDFENFGEVHLSLLQRWCQRNNIKSVKGCGEIMSADIEAAAKWNIFEQLNKPALQRYKINKEKLLDMIRQDQVGDLDETGLYWKRQLDRSMADASEPSSNKGRKLSKSWISLCFAVTVQGKKLPTQLINIAKLPRSCRKDGFKGTQADHLRNYGVFFSQSKKSWQNQTTFQHYVKFLAQHIYENLHKNGQFIMLLDNARVHEGIKDNKVRYKGLTLILIYFPARTTSILQPLDQHCIASFKQWYVKIWNDLRVQYIDFDMEIADAMEIQAKAWNKVETEVIEKSWRNALKVINNNSLSIQDLHNNPIEIETHADLFGNAEDQVNQDKNCDKLDAEDDSESSSSEEDDDYIEYDCVKSCHECGKQSAIVGERIVGNFCCACGAQL